MEKVKALLSNQSAQYGFISIYLLVASLWLHFAAKSIIAFLMLLFSFLVLYYSNKIPTKTRIIVGVLIFTILLPFASGGNQYYMEVASNVGIYIAMALGLNIVVGFAGLLDLGYVAFFAAGAYSYAIFATAQANNFMPAFMQFPLGGEWFWPFLLIGLLVAAIFGILLGLPVLKVKGDYLAIVTLGFGEIIRIVFNNLDKPINITNGPRGIPAVAQPELFGFQFNTSTHYYYLVLIVIAVIIIANKRLENSRLGRAWIAIREDELAAQAMGIPLVRTKLLAFATGASFAGIVGVIFAAKQTFIDPTSFILMQSISILVMVILGGNGSVPGVIVGGAIITVLNVSVLQEISEWLQQLSMSGVINIPNELDPSKFQRLIFGLILISIAIFRPMGIIPAKRPEIDLDKVKELDQTLPQTGILAQVEAQQGRKSS
ncbi:branched-chain amino acid ABC transporter permease [Ammoniphilus sp. CFH 90114]|uniref:branched-chain amino acid ABC transporter permease n=1 Tax=Ammoniphilus sp. CFH 90114 TaxID=2493665 RepID=UPI00100F02A0|nr:branched-chain amino acid ABC transporter permease [Ammoniphilus sp. CFH 90114]RXT05160.1 branched-chain amino acid ABC transporter permease [Ammoniphilus sp. CFH 90114]